MDYLPDSFALHPDAQAHVARLRLLPELHHTRQARLVCIGSQIQPRLHGHPCRAFICQPRVQGPLAPWFGWALSEFCRPLLEGEAPEFLIVLDAALWASYSPKQREALAFHELFHLRAKEDPDTGVAKLDEFGRPVLEIAPHDHELFSAEIERYGPELLELDPLLAAIIAGQKRHAQRRRA